MKKKSIELHDSHFKFLESEAEIMGLHLNDYINNFIFKTIEREMIAKNKNKFVWRS